MTLAIVFFSATVIAAICLELVRNKDYEDGIVGRIALWVLFLACLARASQIFELVVALLSKHGEKTAMLWIDNIETVVWVGLLLFMARHYYRFRRALHDPSLIWRPSQKVPHE